MASRGQTCTDDESCLGSHTFCYQNGCDCNRKSALEGDDCDQPSAASAWSLAVRTIVLLGYLVVFTKCCWVIQQHRRQWGPLCSWRAKRATVFFLLVASVVMCISPLVGIANTLGWHIRKNVFMDLTTYADAFGASVGLVAYLIVAFNWLDIISSTQSLRSMKTGGLLRRSKVAITSLVAVFVVLAVSILLLGASGLVESYTAYNYFGLLSIVTYMICGVAYLYGAYRLRMLLTNTEQVRVTARVSSEEDVTRSQASDAAADGRVGAQYGVRSDPIERAASPLRLLAVLADDVVVGPATRLAASTVQFVREASRGSEESSNERRTSQWAAQEVRQGRWPLQQPLLHTAPAVANVHAVSNAFAQVMKTASRVGASVWLVVVGGLGYWLASTFLLRCTQSPYLPLLWLSALCGQVGIWIGCLSVCIFVEKELTHARGDSRGRSEGERSRRRRQLASMGGSNMASKSVAPGLWETSIETSIDARASTSVSSQSAKSAAHAATEDAALARAIDVEVEVASQ